VPSALSTDFTGPDATAFGHFDAVTVY